LALHESFHPADLLGIVLWGPATRHTFTGRLFPDEATRLKTREDSVANKGTRLAEDFFSSYPAIENLVGGIRCNLRLARGSEDPLNSDQEMEEMAAQHSTQSLFATEVVRVEGVGHSVDPLATDPGIYQQYLRCLFSGFGLGNSLIS
jgi:hypothetical protein